MANFSFQLGSGGPDSKAGSVASRIVLFLFGTPFAAFGLFAVGGGIKKLHDTGSMEGIFIALFGLVFAAFGLGLMYAAVTAECRRLAVGEKWRAQTDGGSKPLARSRGLGGGQNQIRRRRQWKAFLFMGAMFSGIGGTATFFVVRDELPKGNYLAALVLIFPLIGLGFSLRSRAVCWPAAVLATVFFELAAIPGTLGGTLAGLIQTSARLTLEHGLHLTLSCIRITVSGSGDDRSTRENILWQNEKVFKPDAALPESEPGRSGIPVYFKLPADQPESFARWNESVVWRLVAKAKMSGPGFSAIFDVPVFKVAGATVAAADEPDPTASLQMPVAELRRDEHSKIQVTVGPGGREFYFPAARNLGSAFMVTFILTVWSGFLWLMIVKHAPILFPIIFGLFEVLIFWGCLMLWVKSSRVTVNSSGVTLQNRWLIFSRTRQFAPGEIVRFDTKVGMTSGNQVFQDLKLITRADEDNFTARKARFQQTGERPPLNFRVRDPGGITLASSLASKPEADWLVQEMTKALVGGRAN